jgi:hypothetical protein
MLIAHDARVSRDREWCPGLELNAFRICELADSDLGTLQIEQNSDCAAASIRFTADDLQHLEVIFVTAVRKIQTRDVHACVDQLADAFR